MNKITMIVNEIEDLPDPLLEEIYDFVQYLKQKMVVKNMETLLASESSLKKDWLRPEEDEAWRNL